MLRREVMNERLKELMIQADYPAPELALRAHRLAELIVLECMQVVHNGINNATDWDSSSWDQCCENRIYAIQRHFGVRE
jgi:hypothetical protein